MSTTSTPGYRRPGPVALSPGRPGKERKGSNITKTVVIVDAVRLASGRGKRVGALAHCHPIDLLAEVIRPLMQLRGVDPSAVEDVIVGCLAHVRGQSVNIARNAVLAAAMPTVDRQCGQPPRRDIGDRRRGPRAFTTP